MVINFLSAALRGILVCVVICTPSLLLPASSVHAAQTSTFIGLALGLVVTAEYWAAAPSILAFRSLPPINRIRILTLFVMLFGLSVLTKTPHSVAAASLLMTEQAAALQASQVITMVGFVALTGSMGLVAFLIVARTTLWPGDHLPFNPQINLPNLGFVHAKALPNRLRRDGRLSLIAGLLVVALPPALTLWTNDFVSIVVAATPKAQVWLIALWAFASFNLILKGLALGRLSALRLDDGEIAPAKRPVAPNVWPKPVALWEPPPLHKRGE